MMPGPRSKTKPGFLSFLKDRSGAVAITVALASVVLFVAAGVAIDMARAYRAKHALQINVDQAAIAAAAVAYSEQPGDDPDLDRMEEVAAKYFSVNNSLSPNLVLVTEPPQFSYDDADDNLVISVPARLETTFLKIIDINEISFTVSSKVARPEWGPLELALVLDRTWSMNERLNGTPKYQTLQTAAKGLIDLLASNPNAKVGIVPFATWLKVDRSYWDQNWLDRPADIVVPPRRVCNRPCLRQTWVPPYSCIIDQVPTTCPGYWRCDLLGDETCVNQPGYTLYYDGCFSSRATMPTSIDNPTNPRYRGMMPKTRGCAQTSILDLTNSSATLKSKIDSLVPVNDGTVTETYIPGGLEFGWHMLRSGQPLDRATTKQQAQALGLTKAILLMSDGFNTTKPAETNSNPPSPLFAFSPNPDDRAQFRATADASLASLCASAKADGIVIFTVSFAVNDQAAKDLMRTCASSPSHFYEANTSAALLDAFRRIGAALKQIRIM